MKVEKASLVDWTQPPWYQSKGAATLPAWAVLLGWIPPPPCSDTGVVDIYIIPYTVHCAAIEISGMTFRHSLTRTAANIKWKQTSSKQAFDIKPRWDIWKQCAVIMQPGFSISKTWGRPDRRDLYGTVCVRTAIGGMGGVFPTVGGGRAHRRCRDSLSWWLVYIIRVHCRRCCHTFLNWYCISC